MKGVVFTELIEFVEESFGFEVADDLLEESGLEGVYTQAGNYPFDELLQLVITLSNMQNIAIAELLEGYGKHLFNKLITIYPHVEQFTSTFDLLSKVDNVIHPEVLKLYPEAELPTFTTIEASDKRLVLQYISKKPLAPFAIGLMKGAAAHYGEEMAFLLHDDKDPVEIEVIKA